MVPTDQHRAMNLRYDGLRRERAADARCIALVSAPTAPVGWTGGPGHVVPVVRASLEHRAGSHHDAARVPAAD